MFGEGIKRDRSANQGKIYTLKGCQAGAPDSTTFLSTFDLQIYFKIE